MSVTNPLGGTQSVYFDPSSPTVTFDPSSTISIDASDGSFAVYFSPSAPAIRITDNNGDIVDVDPTLTDGEANSTNSLDVNAHLSAFNGTTWDRARIGSGVSGMAIRVVHATDVAGSVNIVGVNTSNTLGVYLSATAGTINVSSVASGTIAISAKDGTFAVYFSPSGQTFSPERVSISSLSRVPGDTSSAQLLPSSPGRKGAYFFNDSTASLYIRFGTTAATTTFTVRLFPLDYYELPQPIFTGKIDGIWDGTNVGDSVKITELS